MRDTYVECVAPRPRAWWKKPLFIFLICLVPLNVYLYPAHWAFLIVAGLFAVLAYLLRQTMNVEYEYLFTGNELSIDKVINQKKRKHLANYRTNKIDIFAPIDAPQLYNYRRRCTKTLDYSSGKYSDQYVMCYIGQAVILTPSKKLLAAIKPELSYNFID